MAVRLFSWISCIPLMHSLNSNNRGIHLNYQASREKNHFLDLTISVSGESFITSTYFKPTDRNSFIPNYSCHHASWLRSVPKSQYLRLKRNCTQQSAFLAQAPFLLNDLWIKDMLLSPLLTPLIRSNVSIEPTYWKRILEVVRMTHFIIHSSPISLVNIPVLSI